MFVNYLIVFLISMIPIVELRGAIPVAIGMGLDPVISYIICIIGNMLPVPIIYFFARICCKTYCSVKAPLNSTNKLFSSRIVFASNSLIAQSKPMSKINSLYIEKFLYADKGSFGSVTLLTLWTNPLSVNHWIAISNSLLLAPSLKNKKKNEISSLNKQLADVNKKIDKIYEDKISETLREEDFKMTAILMDGCHFLCLFY